MFAIYLISIEFCDSVLVSYEVKVGHEVFI